MAGHPPSLLRPLAPPRKLTHEIAERIATDILSGKLPPGARLPTEQELVAALGVSRTVVREAVAALRAEGLILTRQGVGAFVAADVQRRPFRLAAEGLGAIETVLDVMELRAAVEVEAASLAAQRREPAALRRIGKALAGIDSAIGRGEAAIAEDFEFHRAIAEATGNPQFPDFLKYLGSFIIPRQSVRVTQVVEAASRRAYLETIQGEHRRIYDAIGANDEAAARDAMRQHLTKSQGRYRRLAAGQAEEPPATD
ncbi:MAG TPA: FadR/GntR family transcriptional regulator [bacterium]